MRLKEEQRILVEKLALDCYLNKKMSCQEIVDLLKVNHGLHITRQWVWQILKKKNMARTQEESMKTRVVNGRMDYAKSTAKIDYDARDIDYTEIALKRLDGYTESDRLRVIPLTEEEASNIRALARANKMTISDTLKENFPDKRHIKTLVIGTPRKKRKKA